MADFNKRADQLRKLVTAAKLDKKDPKDKLLLEIANTMIELLPVVQETVDREVSAEEALSDLFMEMGRYLLDEDGPEFLEDGDEDDFYFDEDEDEDVEDAEEDYDDNLLEPGNEEGFYSFLLGQLDQPTAAPLKCENCGMTSIFKTGRQTSTELCPSCGKPMSYGGDLVICPVCHKQVKINKDCLTEEDSYLICPSCGKKMNP